MALTLFVTGCKDDEPLSMDVNLQGLENLGSGYAYEGWLIVDGAPVSTGTFTVADDGTLSQTSFDVEEETLNSATEFVLSVEPVPDADPAPSAVKILQGAFNANTATVDAGIVGDFSSAAGNFLIATPTSADMNDELSGVWFIDNSSGSMMPGLTLPTLEDGWIYEGWVVLNGTPVSTGTFRSVSGNDDSAPFSGTDGMTPPFPGEDFVMNAPAGLTFPTDLTNVPIVVSIEPVPDNSTAPFTLKPLTGASPAGSTAIGTSYGMDQNLGSFPSGTVTKVLN